MRSCLRSSIGSLVLLVALSVFVGGCETSRPQAQSESKSKSENLADSSSRGLASGGAHVDSSGYLYDPADTSCGGFPRLQVETMAGTCLGLVMPKERAVDPTTKSAFSMPRSLAQIPGTSDFLVVDMGSWHPKKGSLYRMSKGSDGTYSLTLLKSGLSMPHMVRVGPDGHFWIGEMQAISRFDLQGGKIVNWTTVVSPLNGTADDAHPLAMFSFDPRNNDLYINSGAPSDHCTVEKVAGQMICPASNRDGLATLSKVPWKFIAQPPAGGYKNWAPVALGLRNSMAIAIHPSGTLIQGENSRDFPSLDEPYEEMNVVDISGNELNEGYHYGWPYCYDFHATSPEWKISGKPFPCNVDNPVEAGDYQAPYILIPPHAAPLSAGYYKGPMFDKELGGKLLMTWHGYQPTGHRLVAYNVDDHGRPILGTDLSKAAYNFDQGEACPISKKMKPDGGLVRYAPYTEVISRWNAKKGIRPRGAPVSFTVTDDGSVWIADDKNQTIVRLAHDASVVAKEACTVGDDQDRIQLLAWRRAVTESPAAMSLYGSLQTKMITKYCAACHGGAVETSVAKDSLSVLDFLTKSQWFIAGDEANSKGLQAAARAGKTPDMPPAGSPQFFGTAEGTDIINVMKSWIGAMPKDVDSRYAKTTLPASRNVRSSAGTSGTVCGSLPAGADVYIDPRSSTFTKANGWMWARVYLTPDHKALSGKTCKWPQDGVFYIATTSAP